MSLFSEEDRAWLEDVCWDLEEIVNEACDFVRYVGTIGEMAICDWNVSIASHTLAPASGVFRPAVLNGLPDVRHWQH